MQTNDMFDEDVVLRREKQELVLDLDGFEGPIDLLLDLAKRQQVDLARISILALAEQYLDYILGARKLKLEIAAEYLVMAAWLAYLKSRLLLPDADPDDEISAPELAGALAFRLQRLNAMRTAGEELLGRPRLGRDVFPRGAPEGTEIVRTPVYRITLFELLKAYGNNRSLAAPAPLTIKPLQLYSVEDAVRRLSGLMGYLASWEELSRCLPEGLQDGVLFQSAVASTFAASLQLVKEGKARLSQSRPFAPIMIRAAKSGHDQLQ